MLRTCRFIKNYFDPQPYVKGNFLSEKIENKCREELRKKIYICAVCSLIFFGLSIYGVIIDSPPLIIASAIIWMPLVFYTGDKITDLFENKSIYGVSKSFSRSHWQYSSCLVWQV